MKLHYDLRPVPGATDMIYRWNLLGVIALGLTMPLARAAGDCPQILASLVQKYDLRAETASLADVVQEVVCNGANTRDESFRIDLRNSQLAYLSLERRPRTLLDACAAKDHKFFERHAVDLALWAGPPGLPKQIMENCRETGLHMLGSDSGTQVKIWAHYFGADASHPPVSEGLEYDHQTLDCGDEGMLAKGKPIGPGVQTARCERRTRGDIPVTLRLVGGKGEAAIVLVGERTHRFRYSIQIDGSAAFCAQDAVRLSDPAITLLGPPQRQHRELIAYCEALHGDVAVSGPGLRRAAPLPHWSAIAAASGNDDFICERDGVAMGPVVPCSEQAADWPQCRADYYRIGRCASRQAAR